jgi:predicted component of type VI protein secretion system
MAKLYLTFEGRPLKEFTLSHGVITIGRLPDNLVQVDNLAVSGHHAKVYWQSERYVVEDNGSTNGTYVNDQRITKHELADGDKILIGKHTLEFVDEWHEDGEPAPEQTHVTPPLPEMNATVMLDTRKAKEMLAQARASSAAVAQTEAAAAASTPPPMPAPAGGAARTASQPGAGPGMASGGSGTAMTPAPVFKDRVGMLRVLEGKTDAKEYRLSSKLTMIGKNSMATIRLKGWFAPDVAASITRRDNGYMIAAQDKSAKMKVAGADVPPGAQHDLADGDTVEVAGVKMSFTYDA